MRISFLLLGRESKLHRCEGAFAADDCTAEIAIDALFDHRDTLRVLGFHNFDRWRIISSKFERQFGLRAISSRTGALSQQLSVEDRFQIWLSSFA